MTSQTNLVPMGVLVVLFALATSLVSADLPDVARQEGACRSPEGVRPLGIADDQPYQYMVKYVCGEWLGLGLEMGTYDTMINVYNYADRGVRIFKRPSLSYSETTTAPPDVVGSVAHTVRARRALFIDCNDVYALTGETGGDPIEGMIHLSPTEVLPVAAAYTTVALDGDGDFRPDSGPSFHEEQYGPFTHP